VGGAGEALETSLEVVVAALETSLEMVWMQPRLPTYCHRTEHYDDLAIEQLDLGWGRICYKKGMTYYYEQIVNYLSQYKLMS
jgi:hypothetical protein